MNFVIPMAGIGSRFLSAGYTTPKPLIPIHGTPMYIWSVNSLPLHLCERLIFIVQKNSFSDELISSIEKTYQDFSPRIVTLNKITRGQAETVGQAKSHIDFSKPTLIHNADTAFLAASNTWDCLKSCDGNLLTFKCSEPRWSYAKIDNKGKVIEVREKVVISPYASTGTYYFKNSNCLFKAIEDTCLTWVGPEEIYISPLYNSLIASGKSITLSFAQEVLCFGTPQDLLLSLDKISRLGVSIGKNNDLKIS